MKPAVKGFDTKLRDLSGILLVSIIILLVLPKSETGSLHGRVVDCENGVPLKSVRIVVSEAASNAVFQTSETDADGYYRFDGLPTNTRCSLEASMQTSYEARTIGLRISSGQDNEAPAVCLEEQAPATSQSAEVKSPCGPLFFPLNSQRINDEHKACLDEIALGFEQDRMASLVIDGHRNSSERSSVSRARSNNARDYLVKEKGIDAARITIRDYANTCPHESGDSRLHRRVEFWIVPEGRQASDAIPKCITGAQPRITSQGASATVAPIKKAAAKKKVPSSKKTK